MKATKTEIELRKRYIEGRIGTLAYEIVKARDTIATAEKEIAALESGHAMLKTIEKAVGTDEAVAAAIAEASGAVPEGKE